MFISKTFYTSQKMISCEPDILILMRTLILYFKDRSAIGKMKIQVNL